MENRHLRIFIAIQTVSRIVRPPRLFLLIPTDPKTSAKANFQFQRRFKFFSRTSNPTFTFSREQILGLFAWKWLLKSQNLLSWKREGWIWIARKKFWNVLGIQNLLMQTSLGPWVSAKLNPVAVRRVKQFLSQWTCGGGDFPCFEVVSKVLIIIMQKSLVKNCLSANNKGNVLTREKKF